MSLKKIISQMFYEAAKATWKNRQGKFGEVIVPYDDFSGFRIVNVSGLPSGTYMEANCDGIGTKIEVAERLNDFRTLAYDLLAMVCDDAVSKGVEPVLLVSVFDARKLNPQKLDKPKFNKPKLDPVFLPQIEQLLEGYVCAAQEAGIAIVNGETAELGSRVNGYGNFNFNWSATAIGFVQEEKLLTGRKIVPGDAIVGLKEDGFRSNGFTLARKAFSSAYGKQWHDAYFEGKKIGEHLLLLSDIYTPVILEITGGLKKEPSAIVHGIAHITGGGIPEKLSRTLKSSGYGAELDSLFQPCSAMWLAQGAGRIKDEIAYATWNMGQGMLVITPEAERVISVANEQGIEAKVVGKVVEEKGIKLVSEGLFGKGKELFF